jgi:hypothetical protein
MGKWIYLPLKIHAKIKALKGKYVSFQAQKIPQSSDRITISK